jgi:hypothetical protein
MTEGATAMPTRFHTEKTHYRLTLKEKMNGEPYFRLEPYTEELSIVESPGWLGIELRPGTTYELAEAIGRLLHGHFWGLSYARPVEVPDEED